MALPVRNVSAPGYSEDTRLKTDIRAMSVATALFFMVGFLTCLNDIVIPHLKSIFELDYTQAILVQFAFFSSYFVFSYPGGKLVDKIGYKRAMVVGLFVMAAGAAGFLPAAYFAVFPIFLGALIVLAAGMTVVQVAVNPYVTVIGPAATASSRLNLAQALNSFGTFIAPLIGGLLILGGATQLTPDRMHSLSAAALQSYREMQAHTVTLPYIVISVTLILLAIALAAIKLKPQVGQTDLTQDFRPGAFAEALSRKPATIWQKPWLLAAALGIFTYVGAEVAIGSFLVNYLGLPQIAGIKESVAAVFLTVYWGGAMVGRFIGAAILQRIRTGPVLGAAGIVAFLLVVTSIFSHGSTEIWTLPVINIWHWHAHPFIPKSPAMWSLLFVGLFNSIMFPSIFTLGVQDLGPLTSKGSSLLIAAILGGAILPQLTGVLADHIGLQAAFLVPALCYIYIACFGLAAIRRPAGSDTILMSDPAA